ncbi:MAG TPA: hypothetical protein VFJ51_13365 [Nitrososphaeraceae archaeon]|nr:hypothetical protein [Nitrososphaeraceae archaeon]
MILSSQAAYTIGKMIVNLSKKKNEDCWKKEGLAIKRNAAAKERVIQSGQFLKQLSISISKKAKIIVKEIRKIAVPLLKELTKIIGKEVNKAIEQTKREIKADMMLPKPVTLPKAPRNCLKLLLEEFE